MAKKIEPISEQNPTQDLKNEHAGIQIMLRIMEKISGKLKKGEEIPQDHLNRIHEFLKTFADKCHHGKEEGILFPELTKNPQILPLINQLLGEHKTGRDYIRGIGESLEIYSPGSADAIHIAVNMEGYIALLTRHIETENKQLFPIADHQIPEQLKKELVERFEQLEREVIGIGRHEEYHRWLEELSKTYSSK
jgi:hemerythrin-like domain-containing protein